MNGEKNKNQKLEKNVAKKTEELMKQRSGEIIAKDVTNKNQNLPSSKSENNKSKNSSKKTKNSNDSNKKNNTNNQKDQKNKQTEKEKTSGKKIIQTKEPKEKKVINKNTEDYVNSMIVKRKRRFVIIIVVLILLFVVAIALTAFSIVASLNGKIVNGVSINGIDVSGLTTQEATEKINKIIEENQIDTLNLEYEDYENSIERSELTISFDIESAVKAAYNVGRDNNVIYNNFNIIKTNISKKSIGLNYTYNTEMLDATIQDIGSNLPGLVTEYSYCIEDDELIITPGTDGIILNTDALTDLILTRFCINITEKDENIATIPVIEKEADPIDLEKIYEEVYAEPQDAYIIEDPLEIVADKDGIDFAITMEEAEAIIAEDAEEYIIPLSITEASTTVKDLGSKAFPDKLATYSTKYDASNTSRSTNLELAAEKIDGTVLLPGEEFSYNQVVGKRTIENGYQEAAIYTANGVEQGVGGGICQISTTLYNAALLANLEITDRTNHGYVTSYSDPGRDATVVYGSIDFKFKNTRSYPIKIEATVKNGVATMTIMGIKEEVEYTIKIRSSVTETIAYTTKTIKNSSLAEGTEKIKQKGTNGCKAVCYKDIYLDGELIETELVSKDTYRALNRIVEVGTKKSSSNNSSSSSSSKESPSDSKTSDGDSDSSSNDSDAETSGSDDDD